MHWYGGSIAEAVTLLKQKNAIFVVFVDGENEMSAEMSATIDDAAIVSRLSNETNFLAIKLKSGTPNYTHFAQIYQFVPVPSLFFIGRNGTPLEVVCAGVQASNLATRIDRILAEHHYEKPPLAQPSTSSSSQNVQATVGLLQSEANAGAPVNVPGPTKPVEPEAPSPPKFPKHSPTEKPDDKNYEIVCEGDVCVRRPKTADQPSTSHASTPKVVTSTTEVVAPTTEVGAVPKDGASPTPEVVAPTAKVVASTTEVGAVKADAVAPKPKVVAPAAKVVAPTVIAPTSAVVAPVAVAPPIIQPMATLPKVMNDSPEASSSDSSIEKETEIKAENGTEKNPVEESSSTLSVEEKLERANRLLEAKRREKAEKEKELERANILLEAKRREKAEKEKELERANILLEAKRREKSEKEKELERQKELERRNTGQGVAELKKWQADQEMKQLQEERKREKQENNLARQRILEQIAQDRAERKARDNPPPPVASPPPVQQTTSRLPTSGDAVASARVQFKLPDGTSHTAHFDADGTLAQVQRYVADNLQLSASSFALWTAFPRRELTALTSSLRQLQLTPSVALLVLPRRPAPPAAAATPVATLLAFFSRLLITYFYQPSVSIFTWISSRLFPPPAVTPRPTTPTGPPPPGVPPRGGPLPRRRTNIHRFPGDAGNDDDNNTWNGNSTQQM